MNKIAYTAIEARQGSVGDGVRYVLGWSLGLIIVAMTMALKLA